MKTIFFARHGKTNFNQSRKYMGSLDIPLNLQGISQAISLACGLKEQKISVIFTSPLVRAVQTATIVSYYLNIPVFIIDGFKERNFGFLEGMKKCQYKKKYFPRGENIRHFQKRVMSEFNKINKDDILIISHSEVFKVLIKQLNNKRTLSSISNGEVVKFTESKNQDWIIEYI